MAIDPTQHGTTAADVLVVEFPRRTNPDTDRAQARQQAWGRLYGVDVHEPHRWEKVLAYRPATLIIHSNPDARGDVYDLLVDEMSFYVYFDDLVDELFFADPAAAAPFIGKVADVLDDDVPRGRLDRSIPAVAMFADVWERCAEVMPWQWRHRAAGHWLDYLWGNLTETINRRHHTAPTDLDTYLTTRRGSIALTNCQDKHEIIQRFLMPASAMRQPVLQRLLLLATDLVILGNDLVSYQKEDALGDPYNSVLLLRDHHRMTLTQAVDHVTSMVTGYAKQLHHVHHGLPDLLAGLDPRTRRVALAWEEYVRLWIGGFATWQALAPRYDPPIAIDS